MCVGNGIYKCNPFCHKPCMQITKKCLNAPLLMIYWQTETHF